MAGPYLHTFKTVGPDACLRCSGTGLLWSAADDDCWDCPECFGSGWQQEQDDIPYYTMEVNQMPEERALSPDEVLRELFTYHAPPDEATREKYNLLREQGYQLALAIHNCCPPGPDRTAAVRLVREAVMTANAAIANNGLAYR